MEFNKLSEEDYPAVIEKLIELNSGSVNRNFFLSGDLGAGKTTFIREFCRVIGVEELVTSPSFTLMNTYSAEECTIYHLDLYRLNTIEEAYEIGVEEVLEEEGIKFFEWMDKFPELMKNGTHLTFMINDDFSRNIKVEQV